MYYIKMYDVYYLSAAFDAQMISLLLTESVILTN